MISNNDLPSGRKIKKSDLRKMKEKINILKNEKEKKINNKTVQRETIDENELIKKIKKVVSEIIEEKIKETKTDILKNQRVEVEKKIKDVKKEIEKKLENGDGK